MIHIGDTISPAQIKSKLLTVDGAGSLLDCDLFDGIDSNKFMYQKANIAAGTNLNTVTTTGLYHQQLSANATLALNYPEANAGLLEVFASDSMIYQYYTVYDTNHSVYVRTYYNSVWYGWNKLLDSNHMGSGSGIDADKVDGHEASDFLLASAYTAADIKAKLLTVDGAGSGVDADLFDGIESNQFMYLNPAGIPASTDLNTYQTTGIYYQASNTNASSGTNYPVAKAGLLEVICVSANLVYQRYTSYCETSSVGANVYTRAYYNNTWTSWKTNWNNANDGAGSGLDADVLDGQHGSYYLPASSYTAADVLSKLLTVDGAGTGLDADKLDGNEASAFLLLSNYIQASSYAAGNGYIKLVNGVQICWGQVSITPVANVPTSATATFPRAFAATPDVFTCAWSAAPGTVVKATGFSAANTTSVDIYVDRTDTTATTVTWLAIGS